MKGFSLYFLLMVSSCIACGRVNDPGKKAIGPKIPEKVKKAIEYDYKRSLFYQDKTPDSSIHFARLGLHLAHKWKDRHGEAMMLGRFASINETYGNYSLALKYQKQALTLFTVLNNPADLAAAYSQLGFVEAKQGQMAAGLQSLNKGLALYIKSKDTTGMCRTYTRLGEVYELNKKEKEAMENYSKAETLSMGKGITDDYLSLLNHLGRLNSKNGNHEKALQYYKLGIARSDTPKYAASQVNFLHSAGSTLDSLGKKKEALAFHRNGLQKARDFRLSEMEARSLLSMAEAVKDQDAQESISHLRKALKIADGIGNQALSAEIYHSLSDLYKQQSRYAEALSSLETHHRLIDSLVNINKAHKISVLQSSYQIAESKVRIENLELVNQKRTYERNIVIGLCIGAVLLLFIVWFYFYRIKLLNQRLSEANAVKDKLFSIIGHDLRNPIGGITQLLAVMESGEISSEDITDLVPAMKKQADSSLEILNALLDWGQSQIKGIKVVPVVFKPEENIRKTITVLTKQAADKEIKILEEVPPGMSITGDTNHFDFVMRNLLSNAIKFSPVKGIIRVKAEEQEGNAVFSVKDQGKGISKEQQALFLKGNMDISYGTDGEKGTGIGLLLTKEFVKSNGGKIWMESTPQTGTTFYFNFHLIS